MGTGFATGGNNGSNGNSGGGAASSLSNSSSFLPFLATMFGSSAILPMPIPVPSSNDSTQRKKHVVYETESENSDNESEDESHTPLNTHAINSGSCRSTTILSTSTIDNGTDKGDSKKIEESKANIDSDVSTASGTQVVNPEASAGINRSVNNDNIEETVVTQEAIGHAGNDIIADHREQTEDEEEEENKDEDTYKDEDHAKYQRLQNGGAKVPNGESHTNELVGDEHMTDMRNLEIVDCEDSSDETSLFDERDTTDERECEPHHDHSDQFDYGSTHADLRDSNTVDTSDDDGIDEMTDDTNGNETRGHEAHNTESVGLAHRHSNFVSPTSSVADFDTDSSSDGDANEIEHVAVCNEALVYDEECATVARGQHIFIDSSPHVDYAESDQHTFRPQAENAGYVLPTADTLNDFSSQRQHYFDDSTTSDSSTITNTEDDANLVRGGIGARGDDDEDDEEQKQEYMDEREEKCLLITHDENGDDIMPSSVDADFDSDDPFASRSGTPVPVIMPSCNQYTIESRPTIEAGHMEQIFSQNVEYGTQSYMFTNSVFEQATDETSPSSLAYSESFARRCRDYSTRASSNVSRHIPLQKHGIESSSASLTSSMNATPGQPNDTIIPVVSAQISVPLSPHRRHISFNDLFSGGITPQANVPVINAQRIQSSPAFRKSGYTPLGSNLPGFPSSYPVLPATTSTMPRYTPQLHHVRSQSAYTAMTIKSPVTRGHVNVRIPDLR